MHTVYVLEKMNPKIANCKFKIKINSGLTD